MSTRAVYTFKDDSYIVHVYKHHDGYPSCASAVLIEAQKLAWQGSRFEADEFAAAFAAAAKNGIVRDLSAIKSPRQDFGGGVRLIGACVETAAAMMEPHQFASDTEFLYEITGPDKVSAWRADDGKRATKKPFYTGTFAGLAKKE